MEVWQRDGCSMLANTFCTRLWNVKIGTHDQLPMTASVTKHQSRKFTSYVVIRLICAAENKMLTPQVFFIFQTANICHLFDPAVGQTLAVVSCSMLA